MRAPGTNDGNRSLPPILVAEDDDNDFFFFERVVDRSVVRNPILRFPDGLQALHYLQSICGLPLTERRALAAVLFLDIKMPAMTGLEVLKWAREQRELDWLRIFILSGSEHPHDFGAAERLGADGYLVKYPAKAELTGLISASK